MPAWQLTERSIWNSFRISGKRHLLLTGSRGSGKSTLLKKLIGLDAPGIVTWAVPGDGVFLRETATNEQVRIGHYDPASSGESNRMQPDPEGFTGLGIPALMRCVRSDSEQILIDEIGYLETRHPGYCDALRQLLAEKSVIAAVRKQELSFLTELLGREDAFVIDLDAPFGNTGCVIMASGLGRRFGGNKLMADFHGVPMIARALDATRDIPHRVVVTRHQEVAACCTRQQVNVVLHDLPDRSDTVRLGLQALPDVDRCIFCPGDQPLLSRQTVQTLALLAAAQPEWILRTAADGQPGAPIAFPRAYFPELSMLPKGKGGSFIAKKYPEQVHEVPVRDPYELFDVDTPEDLMLLLGQ